LSFILSVLMQQDIMEVKPPLWGVADEITLLIPEISAAYIKLGISQP
jgi:hypothetical protein